MKSTSSVVTGSVTFAAAGLAPLVEWAANNLLKLAMPPQVVLIVAAGLVTVGHFVVNLINAKMMDQPQAVPALTRVTREGGFARIGQLVGIALLAALVVALSGCSLMPAQYSKIEEGVAQTVVQSSERAICRDIPIGTWMRLYGSSDQRVKGWQAICFNPVTAPLNDETMAALLKVYPSFQQPAAPVPDTVILAPVALPPAVTAATVPLIVPPAPADPPVQAAPAPAKPALARPTRAKPAASAPVPLAATAAPVAAAATTPPAAPASMPQPTLLSAPVMRQ